MDKMSKKRVVINILFAILGEIILLIYLASTYPMLNWQLITSSLLIIIGIILIINIWILRNIVFKENKLFFISIIINPSLVSILSGITLILLQRPIPNNIYFITGLLAILGILTGACMLIIALIKKGIPRT